MHQIQLALLFFFSFSFFLLILFFFLVMGSQTKTRMSFNHNSHLQASIVCLGNAQVAPKFFMLSYRKASYCCTQYIARKGKRLSPINTCDTKWARWNGGITFFAFFHVLSSSKTRPGAYTLLYAFIKLRTFLRLFFNFKQQCGFVKLHGILCFFFTVNLGKHFKTAKLRWKFFSGCSSWKRKILLSDID